MRRLPVLLTLSLTLSLSLAGCHRRVPAAMALPALPPDIGPVMVSVPPPTHPTEPLPEPTVPVASAPVPPAPAPKKPHKHKVKPAPVPPPVQVAASTSPPIALGQLSTGGDAGKDLRGDTETLLAVQKQRLDRLAGNVTAAHTADVEQARRFLKGAEDAWKTGDVDGAHTLAVKAKVLIDDLSR